MGEWVRDEAAISQAVRPFRCRELPGDMHGNPVVLSGEGCATRWAMANDPDRWRVSDAARVMRAGPCRGCKAGEVRAMVLGIEDADALERAPRYRAADDLVAAPPVRKVVDLDLDDCGICGTYRKWSPFRDGHPLRAYCMTCVRETQRMHGRRRMEQGELVRACAERAEDVDEEGAA